METDGEEDVLGSIPPGTHGDSPSVNKRKHDGGANMEEPATKKKRKATPKHVSRKPKPAATRSTTKVPKDVDDAFRDNGTMDDAMKDVETEESARVKKRKAMPSQWPQETKSKIEASTDKIRELVDDTALNKEVMMDGRMADLCLAEISGPLQNQEAAGAKELDKEVARPGRTRREVGRSNINPKKKHSQRKQHHLANVQQEAMDQESQNQQAPIAEQVAPAVAPTRKRKKRKSIGQQATKRARNVVPNARQRTIDSRANHETSDLVNELLDDTIEVAPEKPDTAKLKALESIDRDSTGQPENNLQHAVPSAPSEASCQGPRTVNDLNTTLDPPNKKTEQPKKPKPRKKRRSITQARKPKPKTAMKNDVQQGPLEETDIAPKPNTIIPSSATLAPSSRGRGRKPLSNITNLTPDLAIAGTTTAPAKEITQPPAPPKKRGRPPKNPITDTGNTSASVNDIEKPAPMSETLTASSTRPTAASTKTAKAPAKPQKILKALKDPIPRAVQVPVRSHLDDLDSESDDPLSGASFVRLKKTFKPVKVATRASPELRERHVNRPERSADMPESKPKLRKTMKGGGILHDAAKPTQRAKQISTPQGNSVEDEKRKEAEQKELEGLLSSIGKAVKRGRAMAAGGT